MYIIYTSPSFKVASHVKYLSFRPLLLLLVVVVIVVILLVVVVVVVVIVEEIGESVSQSISQ